MKLTCRIYPADVVNGPSITVPFDCIDAIEVIDDKNVWKTRAVYKALGEAFIAMASSARHMRESI